MGRVYDALRRAGVDQSPIPMRRDSHEFSSSGGEGVFTRRVHRFVPSAEQIEEELFTSSSILDQKEHSVKGSAFTAHTAYASEGTALPNGNASRAAGATLDAARPARARGFVSYDVAAARVEPHLVALTQPRSAYCEQFRSLRTRILQAGEREQMKTFVITSAGMGEGKTAPS